MICVDARGRGVSDDVSFVGDVTVIEGGVDSDELMLRHSTQHTHIVSVRIMSHILSDADTRC